MSASMPQGSVGGKCHRDRSEGRGRVCGETFAPGARRLHTIEETEANLSVGGRVQRDVCTSMKGTEAHLRKEDGRSLIILGVLVTLRQKTHDPTPCLSPTRAGIAHKTHVVGLQDPPRNTSVARCPLTCRKERVDVMCRHLAGVKEGSGVSNAWRRCSCVHL
jgi:hypothetical protein